MDNNEFKKLIENYNFKDVLNIFRNIDLTTSQLELINIEINENIKEKEQKNIKMLNLLIEGEYNKEEFSNNVKNIKNNELIIFFINLEKTNNKDNVNKNKSIILDCLLEIYNNCNFTEKTSKKNYRKKLRNFLFLNLDINFLEEIKNKDINLYKSIKNTDNKKNYSYDNKELIDYFFKNEFINEEIIEKENILSKNLLEYMIENNRTEKAKKIINENILFLEQRYIDKYFKDNNIYKLNWNSIKIENINNVIIKNKSENFKYVTFDIEGAKYLIDCLKDYIKKTPEEDQNKNKNISDIYRIIKDNFIKYPQVINDLENIDYKNIKYLKLEYELKEKIPIIEDKKIIKKNKI